MLAAPPQPSSGSGCCIRLHSQHKCTAGLTGAQTDLLYFPYLLIFLIMTIIVNNIIICYHSCVYPFFSGAQGCCGWHSWLTVKPPPDPKLDKWKRMFIFYIYICPDLWNLMAVPHFCQRKCKWCPKSLEFTWWLKSVQSLHLQLFPASWTPVSLELRTGNKPRHTCLPAHPPTDINQCTHRSLKTTFILKTQISLLILSYVNKSEDETREVELETKDYHNKTGREYKREPTDL